VARRISAEPRAGDRVGRWGGEEFVVLLPGASLEDARAVSEHGRRAIAESPIELPDRTIAATISIGIAAFDAAFDDAARLTARADEALYRAKQGGRNRVEAGTLRAA
jgi:diguanylate cyclase (GGDEF)-like protein